MRSSRLAASGMLSAALFLTLAALSASGSNTVAGDLLQGDADCSGTIGAADALTIVTSVATESTAACQAAADVDCDGDTDQADALAILQHVGGIDPGIAAGGGCAPIGQPLPQDTPPPTSPPATTPFESTTPASPTPTAEVTPTMTMTPTPTPTGPPTTPIANRYALTEILSLAQLGIAAANKVELAVIPGVDDQAILALQSGPIYRVSLSNSFAPTIWGDLSTLVEFDNNEQGLLSIAFAPDFAQSGHVFAYYSLGSPEDTVLARFTATATDLNEASHQTVISIEEFDHRHQGGHIAFDHSGYLLLSLGDGGFSGDHEEVAQDLARLLGKVIRLDVSSLPYAVPPSNPFFDLGGGSCNGGLDADPCEEIFAYGFRNPWRMTVDRLTGEIWLGDVGEGKWEEVDHVVAGGNYGWDCYEGHEVFETPGPNDACEGPFVTPRAVYGHNLGVAIVGGYVYRGDAMPELYGWFVYADYATGRVWAVNTIDDGDPILLHDASFLITSFAEATDGELLIISKNEGIYQLVRD